MTEKQFKYTLPKFVSERIKWAEREVECTGLTPLGVINVILALDEEKLKEDFEWGASQDWLPVTDEFKEWRDGDMRRMKQFMIIHAYTNGHEVAE